MLDMAISVCHNERTNVAKNVSKWTSFNVHEIEQPSYTGAQFRDAKQAYYFWLWIEIKRPPSAV